MPGPYGARWMAPYLKANRSWYTRRMPKLWRATEIVSGLVAVLSLIWFVGYPLNRFVYAPKPELRVAGDQIGQIAPIPPQGSVSFAVTTATTADMKLSKVSVSFNPEEVDLSATRGARVGPLTGDVKFPLEIYFDNQTSPVHKGRLRTFFFDYVANASSFTVNIEASSEADGSNLPFPASLICAGQTRVQRRVTFDVGGNCAQNLQLYGLEDEPGENLEVIGSQAEYAVNCAGNAIFKTVKVLRIRAW